MANRRATRSLVRFLVHLVAASIAMSWLSATHAATARYHFRLRDLETGQDIDMCDLTDRPLIVHLWSPDCPNCKRHMPYVFGLYEKLDPAAVNFVTCTMAQDRKTNLDYISAKGIHFQVLEAGEGSITKSFTDGGWPTTYVFAKGGKLVGTCDTQNPKYVEEVMSLVKQAQKESGSADAVTSGDGNSRDGA